MTEFRTAVGCGKYELTFSTDNKAHYEAVQRTARKCIDERSESMKQEGTGDLPGGERLIEQIDLCHPCAIAIESEGKKLCRPVKCGINNKVTCQRCQRRRYGMTYELVDAGSKVEA